MKARVKATGEIIEVKPTLINGNYIWVGINGCFHTNESLDFLIFTEELSDVKEKSLPKDEPDYWEKLKHQYAGMAMQGMLANCNHQLWEREANSEGIAKQSYKIATALVNRFKEEEK